jgi:PiT family inorganic phosphate transporter
MHLSLRQSIPPVGIALTAILAAALCAAFFLRSDPLMFMGMAGAAAAAYMAINIGANDVANNMGPSVGARALRMGTALAIAATLEVAGALLAGRGVIKTVSQDLLSLDPALPGQTLIFVMIAATLAGALWINASTFVGAPVSTTHAIVGGVVGAGIAAAGLGAVDWPSVGVIAVSWTLSPVLGGVIAAGLHALIRRRITRRQDKIAAARRWVPILIGAMAGTFAVYLQMVFNPFSTNWPAMALLGFGSGLVAFLLAKPWARRQSRGLENRKKQVGRLFRPPLIGAAALLSFAHGANDLANAVAPLAAILGVLQGGATTPLTTPFWVMLIGALGIALGILLFGPRVIRTIGEQITRLNEIRAFCVALSAAITVLAASALALPVSSTHVAVGAVFGVGFLREYLAMRNMHGAAVPVQTYAVDASTLNDTPQQALQRERRGERRFLVRRLKVVRIGAAWVITLPAAALLAALFYALLYRFVGFSAA